MKRLLYIFLAVCCLLTLVGCKETKIKETKNRTDMFQHTVVSMLCISNTGGDETAKGIRCDRPV